MAMIDPEQERRRLEEFYAGQLDGELEQVAGQAYELTDLARESLRGELAKRGLTPSFIEKAPIIIKKKPEPQPGDPPPPSVPEKPIDGEFEFRPRRTIRNFRDLPEALLAKGSLVSAGIDCALVDDNIVRMDWFWSNLMGGVKLLVDENEADAAEDLLNEAIPEHLDVSGIGDFEQPRCPRCGSMDVNFRENSPAAYVLSWVFPMPIPLRRRAWRCHGCYAEWEVEGPDGRDL